MEVVNIMQCVLLSLQVSLHSSVDFSSVYVVINLQTWVLLFDYLGIGVPTPPPSRESSAEPHEVPPTAKFEPPPSLSVNRESTLIDQSDAFLSALEQSLLQDAMDNSSLRSGDESGNLQRRSSRRATSLEEETRVTATPLVISSGELTAEGSSLSSGAN